ncbi:Maltose/maltodextrin import ATP-binding protein MalK [Latilactobacillus sakei]|nr:Maltose/maltodextrin import ATP-binding protein MalK [Latilactobacillus sakei]
MNVGIQFDAVSMRYGQQTVLQQLNFEIPSGVLTTILGPSGCGKSTLLMLIAGLLKPSTGTIKLPEKTTVGMVFQDYALYPHLTVQENIAFPLKMQHIRKKERQQRVQALAEQLQITDCLTKKPHALSGGQQQRVAIARALAKQPGILLLDEPLSNLDARLRLEMRDFLKQLQTQLQITMVIVTHDQDEALHMGQSMLVLNDGVVQQFGRPNQIYQKPQNLFVARFIGNPMINTLSLAALAGALNLTATQQAATATIAIRPESIIAPAEYPSEQLLGTFKGRVDNQETFGSETRTVLQIGLEKVISTAISAGKAGNQWGLLKSGVLGYDAAGQLLWAGDEQ